MTASHEKIALRHGIAQDVHNATFGVIRVQPGKGDRRLRVRLAVNADEELDYNLHTGDTFPVRDQVWQLTDVIDPGTPRWRVVLTRIT